MHFSLAVVISVLGPTFVAAAPALNATTLLQNGQAAQKLNAQFQDLKSGNSCQSGEMACIGNAIAKCTNGQFDTSKGLCEKTQSCFALPNVRAEGTILKCTSLNSALSIINATGATGGLIGDDGNDDDSSSGQASTSTSTSSSSSGKGKSDRNPSNETSSSAVGPAAQTEGPDIVTVTVTLAPAPITVEASTQTLSPEQASSLLLSILGQAVPTPASSVPVASASIVPSAAAAVATNSAAVLSSPTAPSTVVPVSATQITASVLLSSTFAASGPTAAISAAPASSPAAAAAVVAANPSSDGYGSGSYGGY